jgi:hypothetical protein
LRYLPQHVPFDSDLMVQMLPNPLPWLRSLLQ